MKTLELIKKLQEDAEKDKAKFRQSPKNKEMFEGVDDKPDDFKDKTFLYIRATSTDLGERPIPSGTVFWNSPDIELYDSNGILIPTNELDENRDHTIQVVVHNEGDMTCNSCTVDLFICNPSIGFDRPHATQIGIQSIMIAGHNTSLANFSFRPAAENVGHQCLFARAYSYVNGDLPDHGDQFSTRTDRHIGQQNISVVSQGTDFEFLIAPAIQMQTAKLKLKITQNKQPIKNFNFKSLEKLNGTPRTISTKRFLVLKNINKGVANNNTIIGVSKQSVKQISRKPAASFIVRLIKLLFARFRRRKIDPTKFEEIKPVEANTWIYDYRQGVNKVTLDIPYMFLWKNSATIFEIEMTHEESGESVGGLTIIVKA